MRLTATQLDTIRDVLKRRFGADSRIWLFGSRTDDQARGGDIDLFVEPEPLPDGNLFFVETDTKLELERRLRHPVDLIVTRGQETAFVRTAKARGVLL